MGKLEGKIALVTGGNARHRFRDGEAVREGRRLRLHHRAP